MPIASLNNEAKSKSRNDCVRVQTQKQGFPHKDFNNLRKRVISISRLLMHRK